MVARPARAALGTSASGVAGLQARLSAARVGGGVDGQSKVRGRLSFRVTAARNGLAWPACRVPQAQSGLGVVSRASRQYPWRLMGRQARQKYCVGDGSP